MSHLDEGTILALRDDGPSAASAYAHLDDCSVCVTELADAKHRYTMVSDALSTLDGPVEVLAAKAATRARLDRARTARSVPTWRRWPLGRAAAILLATAGAASALTWSPIRTLWAPATQTVEPTQPAAASSQQPITTSVAVEPRDGRLQVILRDAAPGSLLEVAWTDAASARVVAPAGSAFTYADGRIEVDATAGQIRVELPRTLAAATVEVDGVVYVERSAADVTVSRPSAELGGDLVRFVVPGP